MTNFAVVPVLIGPMQVLLTILPGLILAALSALVSILHPRAVWNTLKILWRQKLQVAIVLGVVAGMVWGITTAWRKWAPSWAVADEHVSAQEGPGARGGLGRRGAARSWPMARGNLQRLGAVFGELGPTHGGVQWEKKFSSEENFLATPAVVGNRVYAVSADFALGFQCGKLYCLDADTGAKVWELEPQGYRPTFSSPVVVGSRLVCGEGLHQHKDARIVCVDLSNEREPKVLWTFAANFHVECTPVIAGDRVYVNAGDNGIYCLDLEPGPDGQGREIWHVGSKDNPDAYADAETALAVHDGKVYVGLGRGGNGLVELDAATGKELRRLPFDQPVFSPPAIADGKLYIGMGYGDFVVPWDEACDRLKQKLAARGKTAADIERFAPGMVEQGTVCCVDLASWKVDWKFKTKRIVLGAVAVTADRVYCADCAGMVYCLSRDGKPLASWNSYAPVPASPAVTDKHVYIVNNDGTLYTLDRQTLEPVWQLRLGPRSGKDGMGYLSSPTVARGHVYVGTPRNGLICAGEPGAQGAVPRWPSALGGAGRNGTADESTLSPTGALQWSEPVQVRAPVAVLGEHLLVPVAEGTDAGLLCYRMVAGKDQPELVWKKPLAGGSAGTVVGFGNRVWCVAGQAGNNERRLHAVDVSSGRTLWQAPVAPKASGVLLAADDVVLVQDQDDALTCFQHDGQRLWSAKVGRLTHAPAVTKTMIVVASTQPPVLVVLDRPSGRVLYRRGLEAPPTTSPVVRKDRILLGTAAALEARSLLDGSPLPAWDIDGGGVSADFAVYHNLLIYVNYQGELVVQGAGDGKVQAKLPGAVPGRPPLVARDTVLFLSKVVPSPILMADVVVPVCAGAGGAGVLALGTYPGREEWMVAALQRDKAGAVVFADEPKLWFDEHLEELGLLTTPWVLVDGYVYAGTSAKGLVRLGKK
jgi:outer membrane protein assembly factor BamB